MSDQSRPNTRSRQHLQLPGAGLGRADRIRSRSPSPSAPGTFEFPQQPKRSAQEIEEEQFRDALTVQPANNMATPAQLAAIRDQLRNEIRSEMRAESIATAASIPDAVRRKPEIPAFDKAHIEIWIRRMEHAYTRAGITTAGDKFAWLETKFPVGSNPRIDEFLYGPATQTEWTNFLAYLRKEYGMTKQQKAAIFLDGLKRDGRRPSQYMATLEEKTKDVSVDDIKKEMMLRELPADVRRMLQERIETLSAKDAAQIADNYFDADGRPKNHSNTESINEITTQLQDIEIDESDVHAIGSRGPPRQNRPPAPRSAGKKPTYATSAARQQPTKRDSNTRNPQKGGKLCRSHFKFGDDAWNCEVGCPRYNEKRQPGNGSAGRQ